MRMVFNGTLCQEMIERLRCGEVNGSWGTEKSGRYIKIKQRQGTGNAYAKRNRLSPEANAADNFAVNNGHICSQWQNKQSTTA